MKKLNEFQFETIVKTIQDNLNYPFDALKAEAFGITIDDDYSVKITPIATHGDVYDLLEHSTDLKEGVKLYDAITIGTCGWAAPTENGKDPETKPSEHSDRRRVRLSLAVSPEQTVSYLRFKDDPKEVIIAEDGRGTLAEACQELMKQVINKKAGK